MSESIWMESDTYYLVPLQSPPQMFSASGLSSCSYIINYLHSISSAAVHSQWSRSCTVIPHKKPVPPHIEETGCNLVHRKTPRLISLSIAWYPCIQNPHPRHSQVNWRLSIRQFSWLQFIVSLRLPKKISQWPRTLCVLLQSPSLLQWRDRFGLTKFSIKSKDT